VDDSTKAALPVLPAQSSFWPVAASHPQTVLLVMVGDDGITNPIHRVHREVMSRRSALSGSARSFSPDLRPLQGGELAGAAPLLAFLNTGKNRS
jgi:hypothetical protein